MAATTAIVLQSQQQQYIHSTIFIRHLRNSSAFAGSNLAGAVRDVAIQAVILGDSVVDDTLFASSFYIYLPKLYCMNNTRIFKLAFASVYPHYVQKAEKKGRTKAEVDTIICWLTGYTQQGLQQQINQRTNFETFFAQAPQINNNVNKITGVICGYRVEDIEDKLMQQIRYMDKLIDELAKGKAMNKILRS